MGKNGLLLNAAAFSMSFIAALTAFSPAFGEAFRKRNEPESDIGLAAPLLGLWLTGDGYIRRQLLPNGRFAEARGETELAHQGSYVLAGNQIDFTGDDGSTATGFFKDGMLYHDGMVFYRRD